MGYHRTAGAVAERLKATHLKCVRLVRVSGVRIPPAPFAPAIRALPAQPVGASAVSPVIMSVVGTRRSRVFDARL